MEVDVAVLGLGAMGSAACSTLAARGVRVAGLEQFPFGHDLGSSTGRTRIIRKAYFEHPSYVPLLERSYALWHALELRTATQLLDLFGVLMIGREESATIRGVMQSVSMYEIPTTPLDSAQLRERFPAVRPLHDEVGVLEPGAGILHAERAIHAHLATARDDGALLRDGTPIARIDRRADTIAIECGDGTIVRAARLIVCAGPWTQQLLPELDLPLRVERNVQYWFEPEHGTCGPDALPAFFLERAGWPYPLYGMPDLGDGVKCAFHGSGEWTEPHVLDRIVREDETARAREALATLLPDAAGTLLSSKACMYTMTPDAHFVLGAHPHDERIVIAAGFSGHGFKFAPVIGEIVADLACGIQPPFDLEFLSLTRFF